MGTFPEEPAAFASERASEAPLRRCAALRLSKPPYEVLARDENHASTTARSARGSLLHLWKGSSAAITSECDALR
jgi:hypothetical protein